MDDLTSRTEIAQSIAEVQQSRSRFQLMHFVVNQHDTPEMRFFQICIELQDMEHKLALATLNERESELRIQMLRDKNAPLAHIKADKKQLNLDHFRVVKVGAEREVSILRELFHASPKFTREQIEQAQPDYWRARLTRQYQLQRATGSVGWAQLDAMIQADLMEAPPSPDQNALKE